MADEMKELRGAVFDLIPDGVSVVALDEIEVDDMTPKTRNVKDEDSNKQHRVDDERFGGLVYKLPVVAVSNPVATSSRLRVRRMLIPRFSA